MTFNVGASWQTVYGRLTQGWLEMGFTIVDRGVAIVRGTAQSSGNIMMSKTAGENTGTRSSSNRSTQGQRERGA